MACRVVVRSGFVQPVCVRGERPLELAGSARLSVRRWHHYQPHLHRENPIAKGLEYLRVYEQEAIRSYAQAGKILGVCRQRVQQLVYLVTRLPDEIKGTLLAEKDPEILRRFTERNLRPIAALDNRRAQLTLFSRMMLDAKSARPQPRKAV